MMYQAISEGDCYGANYFTSATVELKFRTGFYIPGNEGWMFSRTGEWLYGGHSYHYGKNCYNGRWGMGKHQNSKFSAVQKGL